MTSKTLNLCEHGQEFYCRICGTISHLADIPEEIEKKDYTHYYGILPHMHIQQILREEAEKDG